MADNDGTDILKFRWSNANSGTNYNRMDECQGACMGLSAISTLYEENCTLAFTLPISRINWYYAVALQIEDYFNSSSIAPMSSVPIQFLFYAYSPSGSCTARPEIIGERPNRGMFRIDLCLYGFFQVIRFLLQLVSELPSVSRFIRENAHLSDHS